MVYRNDEYSALRIKKDSGGNDVWIKGLRSTFAFYGWDQHYDEMRPDVPTPSGAYCIGSFTKGAAMGRRGGRRIRICRGLRQQGNPAGLTNCFRIHSHITNADLAELAHFAGPQVGWMESKFGARIPWELWEDLYQGRVSRLPRDKTVHAA